MEEFGFGSLLTSGVRTPEGRDSVPLMDSGNTAQNLSQKPLFSFHWHNLAAFEHKKVSAPLTNSLIWLRNCENLLHELQIDP